MLSSEEKCRNATRSISFCNLYGKVETNPEECEKLNIIMVVKVSDIERKFHLLYDRKQYSPSIYSFKAWKIQEISLERLDGKGWRSRISEEEIRSALDLPHFDKVLITILAFMQEQDSFSYGEGYEIPEG